MKLDFADIRKGQKVVDRWYSFHPNSFGIQGVGKVLKVSRKKKTCDILFENKGVITYDHEHIEQFVVPYKRNMRKKYAGKIIPG